MKRAVVFTVAVLLGMYLFVASTPAQEDMKQVDNSAFGHPRRPPVPFVHDIHNEKAGIDDCAVCHHLYNEQGRKVDDASSEDQSCADCHTLADVGPRPGLRKAFHLRCKECHEAQGKGPVTCAECHVRR